MGRQVHKADHFFVGGQWVEPATLRHTEVINPATERPVGRVALGNPVDIDRAVAAATTALASWSRTSVGQRIALLQTLDEEYHRREPEFAGLICDEIGAPITYSRQAQVPLARQHIHAAIEVLRTFPFETQQNTTRVMKEGIGVCALITPWNFPLNTVVSKVVGALAAGCCIVLKPSELAPFSAVAFAKAIEAAGFPPGVFNLVNGTGPEVGEALAAHSSVAMVSFTGSTAAGIRVAKVAADTVKRVHQELGGKSANIILPDADLQRIVPLSVAACMRNSGQSCSAPTRLLVPRGLQRTVEELAAVAVAMIKMGDPLDPSATMGPVVNRRQFERVQDLIASGIAQGAKVVSGGAGRPPTLQTGFFVRPTIFSEVTSSMRIAQEEIFGPVLVMLPYDSEDEAVSIANGTAYGLAAYIQSPDLERARSLARRLQAGTVHLNFPPYDPYAPFGGYKQSGNGREYGAYGVDEFLETKAITGYQPPAA